MSVHQPIVMRQRRSEFPVVPSEASWHGAFPVMGGGLQKRGFELSAGIGPAYPTLAPEQSIRRKAKSSLVSHSRGPRTARRTVPANVPMTVEASPQPSPYIAFIAAGFNCPLDRCPVLSLVGGGVSLQLRLCQSEGLPVTS